MLHHLKDAQKGAFLYALRDCPKEDAQILKDSRSCIRKAPCAAKKQSMSIKKPA